VDGNSLGTIAEDSRTVPGLKAGSHSFRAQKGMQFQPKQGSVDVTAGQTADLDLRLTILPVPVEITRRPESTVTYIRAGDPSVHTVNGNRVDLAEGTYTFTANANGYLQRKSTDHVAWDSVRAIDLTQDVAPRDYGITDWDKAAWTQKGRLSEAKAAGFILFPKPLSFVQFTVRAQGGKSYAHWLLHYVNEKNYIQCVIDDEGFRATRFSDAKIEVISTRKAVPKSEWYVVSIEIRPDGATLSLLKGNAAELLGEITESGFGQTKFGFLMSPGQQLFLSDFVGRPW
jgi:hypothetical protein